MLKFKSYIEEEIVSRIDHGPVIKKFDKPQSYHFGPGGSTGVGKKVGNLGPDFGPGQVKKKTFASDLKKNKMGNSYVVPRDATFVYHHDKRDGGGRTIHVDQDTHERLKNTTATLSHFKKKDFKKSNIEGEYTTDKKDLKPVSQQRVNALSHLKKSGIKIKVHKDNDALNTHAKKLNQKAAKTNYDHDHIQGEGDVGF